MDPLTKAINDLLVMRNAIGVSAEDIVAVVRGYSSQGWKSQKPRNVWKRRKNELRRNAKPDCRTCGGRGYIVYEAGGDVRSDECGCATAAHPTTNES